MTDDQQDKECKKDRISDIDQKNLLARSSRRDFIKTIAASCITGCSFGIGTHYGIDYAEKSIVSIVEKAEREIRDLGRDIHSLTSLLDKKLYDEAEKLEAHYTKGKLN